MTITETEAIAQAIIPYFTDGGKKAEYLGFRVANFTVRESCELGNVTEKQVRRWREADEQFMYLDQEGLSELRKTMASESINMQFTRNFHLILQKDFKVLYKDAMIENGGPKLTEDETKYLDKIRMHYTPQSLAMVKQLLGGGTTDKPFDFTKLTMTIRREQVDITQER